MLFDYFEHVLFYLFKIREKIMWQVKPFNENLVPFHGLKALQSLKDEHNNKSYLRLCTTK